MIGYESWTGGKVLVPDVKFVKPILEKIEKKHFGEKMEREDAIELFNKAFKKHKIEFMILQHGSKKGLDKNRAFTEISGAGYFFETKQITVSVLWNFQNILVNKKKWEAFKKYFEAIISHEIVHKMQIDIMMDIFGGDIKEVEKILKTAEGINSDPTHRYFSSDLEIMAFAQQAVFELRQNKWSDEQIKELMKNPKYVKQSDSFSWYFVVFQNKLTHSSWTKFLKTMSKYI